MRRNILVLTMLLMATMAFAQTPRRAANTTKKASTETRKDDKAVNRDNQSRQGTSTSRTQSTTTRTTRSTTQRNSTTVNRDHSNTTRSPQKVESTSTTRTTRTTTTTRPGGNNSTSTTRTTTPRNDNHTSTTRTTNPRSTTSTARTTTTSTRRSNNTATSTTRTSRPVTTSPNRTTTTRSTSVNTTRNPHQAENRTYSTSRTTTVRTPAYRANSARVYYPSSRRYTGTRTVVHHYSAPPRSRVYRSYHYPYRRPAHVEVIWTNQMHHHYVKLYPSVTYWHYPIGYRIETISAYDADLYMGEVMNVYGKVSEVYYSRGTDEYFLYMGPYYPYQDLTIVVPGYIARKFSRRPVFFFEGQHLLVTGLISTFDGNPEIVVKKPYQIDRY